MLEEQVAWGLSAPALSQAHVGVPRLFPADAFPPFQLARVRPPTCPGARCSLSRARLALQ